MGEPNQPEEVKLIAGMLTSKVELFDTARELLVKEFGPVDSESGVLDFNYTDYYEKEHRDKVVRSLQRRAASLGFRLEAAVS